MHTDAPLEGGKINKKSKKAKLIAKEADAADTVATAGG